MTIDQDERLVIGKSDPTNDIYDAIKDVTIPSYIKRIATSAFSHSHIEKIIITSQITGISEKAFFCCCHFLKLLNLHQIRIFK